LGEFINRTPGAQTEIGAGLGKLVTAGLRPPPPVRYPLSEGRAALESLADSGIRGKVVLVP
jgi:NADPH2:quinone reductase